ncbi:hypothetical protein CapIbe_011602 [Capra ibex]
MGCRGCSTISLGAARGAPYPGAATLRPRPPSPARPEGLRETGPEPCPRALALGRPNHQGPAQEAAELLPSPTELGGLSAQVVSGKGGGAQPGHPVAPSHPDFTQKPPSSLTLLFPADPGPNALLKLVKWNQINCSMDLVPFNQL